MIGGLFVCFLVYLGTGVFLCRVGEGHPPFDVIFAVVVPGLLGLAAGVHTYRSSIRRDARSFRLTPGGDDGYPPGHCQTCGYDLTGNLSGVCPECGTEVEKP